MYAKDLSEPKYRFLIEKREDGGIKNLDDPGEFIEYSNTIHDVYKNIDDSNPSRMRKILIVLDDVTADVMTNKKFQTIIIYWTKSNISPVFITQSHFKAPKDVRLNSRHDLIMKIHSRKDLQNIVFGNSADIEYKNILKIYKNCTNEPYSFLTLDTTLPADNSMKLRTIFSDSPL